MTSFRRLCEYIDAARKLPTADLRSAPYGQVVAALADAGFTGATPGELKMLVHHMRGFTETRRERNILLKETIRLMQQYGVVRDPDFRADALAQVVPADDMRGQTVIHDLRQFEADVSEAAARLGKPIPPLRAFDANATAENVFGWVYALQSGLL